MYTETVLADAFAAHEGLAPAADGVLADLDRALISRRRARLAVATTSGVIAVVAILIVVATSAFDGNTARPAVRAGTALPGVSSPIAGSPPPGSAVSVPGPLTFAPGWLPAADANQSNYAIGTHEQSRGYDMKALGTSDLYVAITVDDHGSLPTDTKRGVQRAVTVDGRPAHESSVNGSYQISVDRGSGRLLTVVIQDAGSSGSTVSEQTLSTAGRHIAADVRFDVSDPVAPPLTMTDLPSTLQVTGVRLADEVNNGVEDDKATDYTLGTGPNATTAVIVSTNRPSSAHVLPPTAPGDTPLAPPGKPARGIAGRQVQRHRTEILSGKNAVELIVKNFATDRDVILVARTDTSSLEDLYRIADGLRWNG